MSRENVPQANVELHRRATEAFNTRDLDAYLAYCDPAIELHSAFTVLGGSAYHGHDGVRRWHRDLQDAFGDQIRVEADAYFDLGEQTLSFHVLHGRGQHSGAAVATPAAHLCRWRAGRIVHFKGYLNKDDVLRDLGITAAGLEAARLEA